MFRRKPPKDVSPAFPPICGTALLSIERMRRLRATLEAARVEVTRAEGGLEVRITVEQPIPNGTELPAHVGVSVARDAASPALAADVWADLRMNETVSVRVRVDDVGENVVVRLKHADALADRAVSLRT